MCVCVYVFMVTTVDITHHFDKYAFIFRVLTSTPITPTVASYGQQKNAIVDSLNLTATPTDYQKGAGRRGKVTVAHYDPEKALTKPYFNMFQKVSDKALGLLGS